MVASSSSRRKFCSGVLANPKPGSTTIRSRATPPASARAAAAPSSAATSPATCRYTASESIVSGVPRMCITIIPAPAVPTTPASAAERPAARRVGVAREEATQLRRQALEARRQAVGARERRESAGWCAHQRPALAGEHVGTGLRPPPNQRFALRFGDLFQEDDEGLHAGCGERGGLGVPAAGRERRAHRLGGVRSERGELHRTGLPDYDARSALTMLRRAARAAGRKPPTTPITTAKTRARAITPGESANPNPISEKLWKLTTEIRSKDSSAANATPTAPPTSASITDSTRNAPKTLRRLNPRARRVPTSTVRFATAAYIVIIAPIMAPKLKIVVTTIPSVRMNVASVFDCSW